MSKKLAALLSALAFLSFCLAAAAADARRAPPGAALLTAEARAGEEELMSGRDDPGQMPSELLPGEKVDINGDGAERLMLLPGIGEVLAKAIVDYREANGPFDSPEKLMLVPGIGSGRYEAVKDLITAG